MRFWSYTVFARNNSMNRADWKEHRPSRRCYTHLGDNGEYNTMQLGSHPGWEYKCLLPDLKLCSSFSTGHYPDLMLQINLYLFWSSAVMAITANNSNVVYTRTFATLRPTEAQQAQGLNGVESDLGPQEFISSKTLGSQVSKSVNTDIRIWKP